MKRTCFYAFIALLIFGLCFMEIALSKEETVEPPVETEFLSGDARMTYSEKDPNIVTITTLVPFLVDVEKPVQFNDEKMESRLTKEGKNFYARVRALTVSHRGRDFRAIKGIGFVDGWTVIIRKRDFYIFTWEVIEPMIETALIESGFALKGPQNPGK